MESFSEKQLLYTFYELDQPTQPELNIVKNNSKVIFSSTESEQHFNTYGASNTAVILCQRGLAYILLRIVPLLK